MIKIVFIDIDGTLLDFEAAVEESVINSFSIHGIELPENIFEVFHPINNELWHKIETREIDIPTLRKNRWNIIFSKLGIEYNGEAFENTFFEGISNSAVPFEGALELLEYLSGKYTVCAATNANTNQQIKRLKACGMYPYIHRLFTSEMFDATKPSAKFFDKCFESLGFPEKSSALMIGDSYNADIVGGKNYGLTTIFFDPLHKQNNIDNAADYTVHRLSEIKNIL